MRNLKKFLALVLAMLMMLSVAVISTGAASDDADYTEAAQRLAALQVMKGNENGDLMLDNGVTRYQAALFFVQALTGETETATWNSTKNSAYFGDVVEYGTAIDYAYGIGLILGRGNGVYGYNDAITYQDMLVMAVRALGYETADMSYPYGYILAAQKLGLTENVELVDYKAALTRGETAQIIWDMLDTEVAVTDPITDKILYPGEIGLTDALLGTDGETVTERETLMEKSELAGDKIEVRVTKFVEADEDDEDDVDTVVLSNGVEVAAADLGITADTPAVSYLGLPVELYIDVDEDDFTQDAYDDGDASVVFAFAPTYTDVLNLGDGNLKYVVNADDDDKSYISLGGTKYTEGKYSGEVYTFGANGWTKVDSDVALAIVAQYEYTTKDGYVADAGNTYANVSYRETDRTYVDNKGTETTADDVEKTIVEILYTPLSFGQYNVREVNGTKYTVIGVYNNDAVENLDEETSNFVEYLVDGAAEQKSSYKVTSSTKTISNTKGENAATVTVAGAAVEAGDFMFYVYNPVDNILTVAAKAGNFETGRLNKQSTSNETVTISGTTYEFGFTGLYSADWVAEFNPNTNKTYISNLEAGKDNVKFIAVNGNIVYMEPCSETTNDSKFDFAVVTLDEETMMDLLEITSESKYEAALTSGLYVEDGAVKVAMMNKTTGKWELASIEIYAEGWVAEDEEFDNEYNLADAAKYYDITGNDEKYGYIDEFIALVNGGLVAVIEETDGVYTVAANEDNFFVTGAADEYGISFSDNSNKTNAITADDEIDPARVTVTEDTVIIVIDVDGVAGSRVGVQTAKDSYLVEEGYFLAASSDLIVLVETEAADGMDVADWADAASANSDENWFLTTADTGVEVEAVEDEEDLYIVTVSNVYDMKAMEVVDAIQMEVETLEGALDIEGAGSVLFQKATGEIVLMSLSDLDDAILEVADDNEDKLEYAFADYVNFIDADTIEIYVYDEDVDDYVLVNNAVEAVDVNATVVTLNWTGLDEDEYDFSNVVLDCDWDDEIDADNSYKVGDTTITVGDDERVVWEYELDMDLVNEITEPTDGVLNQYIADTAGTGVLVPEMDNDDFADAETILVIPVIAYNVEDGVVNLVVYKILVNVADLA